MSAAQSSKITRTCEVCCRSFLVFPSAVRYSGAKFCSPACYRAACTIPFIDRFFRYVGRKMPNGCIPWTGCTNADGYGLIGSGTRQGRMVVASRASYELFVGPIPNGLFVLHRCDTPVCINPVHLWLGTNLDNLRDMSAKGRGRKRVPGSRRFLKELRTTS